MKMKKKETTAKILSMTQDSFKSCTKLQLDNILFPKWSDLGLLGMILTQSVKTKEHPEGHFYDEATFQVVMRVIGGKVLMTGRPDAYAWTQEKVQRYLRDPSNIRLIGTNSAAAVLNLAMVLGTITDEKEKMMLADLFCSLSKDLLLITTPSEHRHCIEVTPELIAAGITACVDSYADPDENGEAEATPLAAGDFLVFEEDESLGFYRVRGEEFSQTYSLD